ncbi:MAG: hypothetical protein H6622_05665 [Halobacteriovoraceae bacterium]|nr:hypothetical protein [Halobacteriovoraceae bacterium]
MKGILLTLLFATSLTGCASYTAVTKVNKGKVAIVRNDAFLGGIWPGPKVFVCSVSPNGLSGCQTQENP